MLTRRGLFGVVAGTVAALCGVKAASKLALHSKAFGFVAQDLDTGISMRFVDQWTPLVPIHTFKHPIVDMAVIQGDVYVTTERELWHLVKDGTPERLAHWGTP